jgi:hypothetical protein
MRKLPKMFKRFTRNGRMCFEILRINFLASEVGTEETGFCWP